MHKLLSLVAYYSGKLINLSDIGEKLEINRSTTKKYLGLLEHLFLMQQVPAWHINSYKRLVKTPKLHLADTGLGALFGILVKNTSMKIQCKLALYLKLLYSTS